MMREKSKHFEIKFMDLSSTDNLFVYNNCGIECEIYLNNMLPASMIINYSYVIIVKYVKYIAADQSIK